MPYRNEHVPAEILFEYKGYTIYHTYKDDYYENGALRFWYAFEEDSDIQFDVRDLPNWGWDNKTDRDLHTDCIREAIDHEHLDEIISQTGLPTLKEQEWTDDYSDLQKWQLLEFIQVYDTWMSDCLRNNIVPEPARVESYYTNIFLINKRKGEDV